MAPILTSICALSLAILAWINGSPHALVITHWVFFLITVTHTKSATSPAMISGFFITPYSTYFTLSEIVRGNALDPNIHSTIIFSALIFHIFFYLGCLIKQTKSLNILDTTPRKITSSLTLLFSLSFIISIYSLLTTNAETKSDINTAALYNTFVYFFLVYLFILCTQHATPKNYICLLIIPAAIFVMHYLFSGERDILVRFALMSLVLVYFISRTFHKRHMVLALSIGLLITPLSQALKGALNYGIHGDIRIGPAQLVGGEFMTQGRNFYQILSDPGKYYDIFNNPILSDVGRFLYISDRSSGAIYGSDFLQSDHNVGMGFSLLGQLYMETGFFGIIGLGFFLGFICKVLFNSSLNDHRIIPLYIMILFAAVYSLRADVANLLAGIVKIGMAPYIILFLISSFFNAINPKSDHIGK